jgi:hypothetical protein
LTYKKTKRYCGKIYELCQANSVDCESHVTSYDDTDFLQKEIAKFKQEI